MSRPGLASDVAAYLPNRDAWIELRQYATTQHLVIDTSLVPDAWADAVAQAQPGQIAPGTTAVTIEELAYFSNSVAAIYDVHCILAGRTLERGSEAIRQQIQEALYDMLRQRRSVWFG